MSLLMFDCLPSNQVESSELEFRDVDTSQGYMVLSTDCFGNVVFKDGMADDHQAALYPNPTYWSFHDPFIGHNVAGPVSVSGETGPANPSHHPRSPSPEPTPRKPGQKGRPPMSTAEFCKKQRKLRAGEIVEKAGAKVKYAPTPHSGMSGNRKHICKFCHRRFGKNPGMEADVEPQHPDSTDQVCVPLKEHKVAHGKHQAWLKNSSRRSKYDV